MVPSTYEAGKLYNVLPSGNRAPDSTDQNSGYDQTRADFDFDRGSNAAATRVNASGLIEKYRENFLTYSNDFSDSDWVKFHGSSVTSGQADKDGGTDAWKLDIVSSQSYSGLYQVISGSGVRTQSIYAKAGTLDHLGIVNMSGSGFAAWFDLTNGTIGTQGSSNIDAKIEAVGTDGWYRISVTQSVNAAYFQIKPSDGETTPSGSDGYIYIQDAQLESGLVASSYLDSTSVTGKAGVLVDLPRINYDANGENGALLLEPSRANLYTYSEYSGAWNKTNWTTTDNYAISPEGVKNAFRAVSLNTSGILYVSGTGVTGQKNTLSVWAKSNTGSDQKFRFFTDGNTNTSSDFTATTEWQRFEYTHDCTFVTAGIKGASSELSDILFYGFQHELGSYSSSYIPTMGTSETRAADSMSRDNLSSLLNSPEGTLFLEVSALADDGTNRYFSINDGTTSNYIYFRYVSTSNNMIMRVNIGGVTINTLTYVSPDTTIFSKVALKWKGGDYAFWVNGIERGADTSATSFGAGVLNEILCDFPTGSGAGFPSNTKQVAVFNEALSDSELATLTTL